MALPPDLLWLAKDWAKIALDGEYDQAMQGRIIPPPHAAQSASRLMAGLPYMDLGGMRAVLRP